MRKNQNRFMRQSDFKDKRLNQLSKDIEDFYSIEMKGMPHDNVKTAPNVKTRMLWSRGWEYAWAYLAGNVKQGHIILDCGCGGSPFLPFLVEKTGCIGHGIDNEHGDYFMKCQEKALKRIRYLCNLKRYHVDPKLMFGDNPDIVKGDMLHIAFPNGYFDAVFCISVLEHFNREDTVIAVREMRRVLRMDGKLIITTDEMNPFDRNERLTFQEIIKASGMELDGKTNFSIPDSKEKIGKCHVVGFVLKKI